MANDGSSADITGTIVTGGDQGLLVAPGAAVTFQRSTAQASGIGIKVQDGELVVSNGALVDNGIGLQVGGASFLEVTDTDICNETNFDLRDGALVPPDVTPENQICVEGAESPAAAGDS